MTSILSPPLTLMLKPLISPQQDLQTQGSLLISTGTVSCGAKRRSYRDKNTTLGWLGINGGIRTTQCNIAFRQLGLTHICTPTFRDRCMPLASVTTSTWPSPQESPFQMSFMGESQTPLTVSPCPGCMTKKDQKSVTG